MKWQCNKNSTPSKRENGRRIIASMPAEIDKIREELSRGGSRHVTAPRPPLTFD